MLHDNTPDISIRGKQFGVCLPGGVLPGSFQNLFDFCD
jgi:hypothetical protein